MLPEGTFLPHIAEGKVRILATSGRTRSRFSPGVATFSEQGLEKLVVTEWFGLFAPGRTPAAVAERAAAAIRLALADKDLGETFARSGMVPAPTTPVELMQKVVAETAFWQRAIQGTGFKPME